MKLRDCLFLAGVAISTCTSAAAQTTCDTSGEPTKPIDPALAPKIIEWVSKVEEQVGLKASNWHGLPAQAPTAAQRSMLELQALTADWQMAARNGTVERFFRSAVMHGVDVQYEALMMREDVAHADVHRMWRDTEAARANACLALTKLP